MVKKYQIKKERKSKSARKVRIRVILRFSYENVSFPGFKELIFQYEKQIKKLESDLKEVEAAETISTKLKTVFSIFFHCFFFISQSNHSRRLRR